MSFGAAPMTPTRHATLTRVARERDAVRRLADADRATAAARREEDPAAVLARRDRYRSAPVETTSRDAVAVPVHGRDPSAWLFGGLK